MLWLLWSIPCAIANRIRGGWLQDQIRAIFPFWSTTVARLFVSFIIAIPIFIYWPWQHSVLFFLFQYVGFIFHWAPEQFMFNPKNDIPWMTARGLVLTVPAALCIGSIPYGICGALMGLVYYIAKLVTNTSDQQTAVAELIFGGILGLFIGISVIVR